MSASGSRQVFPDRLRGLALLGIVVVNAPYLGLSTEGYTSASLAGAPNAIAAFLVVVLAQGKFYLLFSFLFGYSATFILKGGAQPNRRRFRRRLLALVILGLLHAVFFFIGDILVIYAVLGFGLLALSRRSSAVVRGWAVGAGAVGILFAMGIATLAAVEPTALSAELDPAVVALNSALDSGTFWEAASARLDTWPTTVVALLILQGPLAFAAFCVGLLAGRSQVLADATSHSTLWPRLALVGVGIGLPLQLVAGLIEMRGIADENQAQMAIGLSVGFVVAPVLAVGYLGLLGLLLTRRPDALRIADAPGRMSLSVYISESIVLSILFCGYGLAFFGAWGAAGVTVAGLLTWLGLAGLSWLWLRRFPQGPLEYLVAKVTRPPSPAKGDSALV